MAEPTSAVSFADLITDVANKLGLPEYRSDGTERLPVSPQTIQYCKKIVNNAVRMFINDAPASGWRWMRRDHSITFDSTGAHTDGISSDAARYMLPQYFGGTTDGPIEYTAGSAHMSHIEWCDYSLIRRLRAGTVQTGYPKYAAVQPYHPTGPTLGSSRRWEIIFDPQPSSNETVEFPYTIVFDQMELHAGTASGGSTTTLVDSTFANRWPDDYFNGQVIRIVDGTGRDSYATVTDFTGSTCTYTVADWLNINGAAGGVDPASSSVYYVEPSGNLHPAGIQFDEAIKAACRARVEMEDTDTVYDSHDLEYYNKVILAKAYTLDGRSAPRKLGNMNRKVDRTRNWNTVTTNWDL